MAKPEHEHSTVSTIELFFDLVFVFVITQITQLVEHAHGPLDFLRALLVLAAGFERGIIPAAADRGPLWRRGAEETP